MSIELPEKYKIYFWDVDWEDLKKDPEHYTPFIIARLADKGDVEQVKWLKAHYPLKKIIQSVVQFRFVSDKTKNFWKNYGKVI